MMKNILIAGGSGLVGSRLTTLLKEKGYMVSILSRSASSSKNIENIQWVIQNMTLDPKSIEHFDHIINLTGAGIADKKWSTSRMKEIIDSRIKPIQLLAKAVSANAKKPKSFISASAVGFYGSTTSEHIYKEDDPAGKDFLGETCQKWEKSAEEFKSINIPTAVLRIGIVLSKDGGALKEIAKPISYGFGAPLGDGKQYIPWIHIDDLCHLFIHALENHLEGTFNAAAPNPVNNETLTKSIAKVLKKPLWLPNVPSFVMALMLGKRKNLVLEGSRVSIEKVLKTGFHFKFQTVDEALKNIYT